MDILSISSAYSSLKEAVTIIKNLGKMKSDAELAEKTIQLGLIISAVQNDLFETQSTYSSAISKINDLESKLKAFEDWSIEKQRYELFKFASSEPVSNFV